MMHILTFEKGALLSDAVRDIQGLGNTISIEEIHEFSDGSIKITLYVPDDEGIEDTGDAELNEGGDE